MKATPIYRTNQHGHYCTYCETAVRKATEIDQLPYCSPVEWVHVNPHRERDHGVMNVAHGSFMGEIEGATIET